MCTAATYKTKDFYFGRTLDHNFSYGEEITITPRNFSLTFRNMGVRKHHYAMIGMAHVSGGYPLYYDAVNEKGLAMAGLNFVGNADYKQKTPGRDNVASFEFIPWILCQCAGVEEVRVLLRRLNLTDTPFCEGMPRAQLHWLIADDNEAITVECVKEGIKVYDNTLGVLTNNPPFLEQMFHLNNYMQLSPKEPKNNFSDSMSFHIYSRGMGALGLPGDLSSQSRFVRAAFTKVNSVSGNEEGESINQFFHILGSVEQQRGCCELNDGTYEMTLYTSCCNTSKGIYYYTTYDNHQITGVDLYKEKLDDIHLVRYPLIQNEQIKMQNE